MKKLDISQKILVGAFLVTICFSWVLWLILQNFTDTTNYENRNKAECPKWTLDNYETFPEQYGDYFDDRMPFRNDLITLNSAIDYFIFHRAANDQVIVGKENWLFYNGLNDGDPIDCYQGTNILTKKELENIADNCVRQRDCLKEQGKEFIIFIAPNKERMYSEYMPEKYGKPAENYQTLQIVRYLRQNTDLKVIYPYDELMNAKNNVYGYDIYYKTDTHWNEIGGYIGARALLRELKVEIPSIESKNVKITRDGNRAGDLAEMLDLTKQLNYVDYTYKVEGYNKHDSRQLENEESYEAEGADERKLYVIRDSFGKAMREYLGSQFKNTYFVHRGSYTYNDLMVKNPDVVVYETVERYAYLLGEFSLK